MRPISWFALAALLVGCNASTAEEATSSQEQPLNSCVACCRADAGTGRNFGQCMKDAVHGIGPCAGCHATEPDAGEDDAGE
jgi:hypothetical protein